MDGTHILSIEGLGAQHPHLNPDLLIESARVALAWDHTSPARFAFERPGAARDEAAEVAFERPDPRSEATYERERLVEFGAVVLAALQLELEGRQITRVVPRRGWHFDYFVGDAAQPEASILEVGGTYAGEFRALLQRKEAQLRDSPYRRPPHSKPGYAAATRFRAAARSGLRLLPPEGVGDDGDVAAGRTP